MLPSLSIVMYLMPTIYVLQLVVVRLRTDIGTQKSERRKIGYRRVYSTVQILEKGITNWNMGKITE